jgi:hypothetical protein
MNRLQVLVVIVIVAFAIIVMTSIVPSTALIRSPGNSNPKSGGGIRIMKAVKIHIFD